MIHYVCSLRATTLVLIDQWRYEGQIEKTIMWSEMGRYHVKYVDSVLLVLAGWFLVVLWGVVSYLLRGENPALQGRSESDNSHTDHRR